MLFRNVQRGRAHILGGQFWVALFIASNVVANTIRVLASFLSLVTSLASSVSSFQARP